MLAVIRGAGDIASAIALRLVRCGASVLMTEIGQPLTVRRTVAFSEAVRMGKAQVEGVTAVRARDASHALELLSGEGVVPVLVDPACACVKDVAPDAVVDAVLAKRNLGTTMDCHAVVETMRGHTLGRAYYEGSALPNTAVPGLVGGFAGERVLRAPSDGEFRGVATIGDHVEEGQVVAYAGDAPVVATLTGVLRGLIADGVQVRQGLKCGDVDPRDQSGYCGLVSDKGLAIAGGVLEAILHVGGTFSAR